MVLRTRAEVADVFDQILRRFVTTRSPVVVLVGTGADSICTAHILVSLFRTEHISYSLHSVHSYDHVMRLNQEILQPKIMQDELHSLVLINCGARIDLLREMFVVPREGEYMERLEKMQQDLGRGLALEEEAEAQEGFLKEIEESLPEPDRFQIYVIDFHRPFDLNNVFENQYVSLVQGEDEQTLSDFPQLEKAHRHHPGRDGASSAEKEEEDEDEDSSEEFDLEDSEEEEDESSDEDRKRKERRNQEKARRRLVKQRAQERTAEQERQRMKDEYYFHTYCASHSAGVAFTMARDLMKDDNDLLWFAILGLSDQFIHERISREQYNTEVTRYQREVLRRNSGGGVASTGNDHLAAVATMDNEARRNFSEERVLSSTTTSHRKTGSIQFSEEFRFVLLRHWTLHDSIYYSPYVAAKLGVWKQRGKQVLREMLVKMSLPLAEATQPFKAMRRKFKKELPALFEKHAALYKLDKDIHYGSFTRQHGSHNSFSAADMVYAMTAVLESDFRVRAEHLDAYRAPPSYRFGGGDAEHGGSGGTVHQEDADAKRESRLEEALYSNFWMAYDMVGLSHQRELEAGIALAKRRQRNIVDMGTKLIEKREVKSYDMMRFALIEGRNQFQSPMLLLKLALFVMDAHAQHRRGGKTQYRHKAFVLASYSDRRGGMYTVVGVPKPDLRGAHLVKSPFHRAFRQASQQVGARVAFSSFEGNVVEVQKDDFREWLDHLHERIYAHLVM